jgi:hypothetical protein
VWSGNAATWIDLHPAGAGASAAMCISGSTIAGWVRTGSESGPVHAGVWEGVSATWFDLHSLLPEEFGDSEARAVSSDGSYVYVTGWGIIRDTDQIEALLWTRPIPAPSTAALLGIGALLATRRRR